MPIPEEFARPSIGKQLAACSGDIQRADYLLFVDRKTVGVSKPGSGDVVSTHSIE